MELAALHRPSYKVSLQDYVSSRYEPQENNTFVEFSAYVLFPGALYPTSMRINDQGRLVVNFRTKARFRGLFVESHSGGRIKRAGETDRLLSLYQFYYSLII